MAIRLLALADQFTQHTDGLARLQPAYVAARGHASAQFLVSACTQAVQAIQDQPALKAASGSEALVRIKQLGYLTAEAGRHFAAAKALLALPAKDSNPEPRAREFDRLITLAQELLVLAPATALEAAAAIAAEAGRLAPVAAWASDGLSPVEQTALHAAARGDLVIGFSGGREYVESREPALRASVVHSLEQRGLVAREIASVPPAFDGGPPHDRIRLTPTGATAAAVYLGRPARTPHVGTTAVLPPRATPSRVR
ncbi:hypothetical protein [Streptomyces erythrochromogenes]|uniref:hypothetical protein n=1 Tax=Streptomyces erythrochromogenes TaxID=285574 RepID=UPI002256CAE0|nr:hypothetical protein [Streptomyces erythrochromogenes]MCX5582964.1 hypothetical protein [Streptomyces erythrochromogenes]